MVFIFKRRFGGSGEKTMENNVLIKYVVVLIVFMTLENCEYKKD